MAEQIAKCTPSITWLISSGNYFKHTYRTWSGGLAVREDAGVLQLAAGMDNNVCPNEFCAVLRCLYSSKLEPFQAKNGWPARVLKALDVWQIKFCKKAHFAHLKALFVKIPWNHGCSTSDLEGTALSNHRGFTVLDLHFPARKLRKNPSAHRLCTTKRANRAAHVAESSYIVIYLKNSYQQG